MEPRNNSMNTMGSTTPEQTGVVDAIEPTPNVLPNPETPIASPEQARVVEQLAADHAGHKPLPAPPTPVVSQPQVAPQPTTPSNAISTANPTSASDGNLIEKEWIDKVKQVINSTADDPHAQQREVSRLMADYVLKRTGRKIGKDGG